MASTCVSATLRRVNYPPSPRPSPPRCIPLALCPELRSDAELVAAARIEVRSTHPHELAQWAGAGLVVLCRRLIAVTPSRLTLEASVKRAADAVAESIPVASSMWAGLTSRLHELPAPSAAPYTLQVRPWGWGLPARRRLLTLPSRASHLSCVPFPPPPPLSRPLAGRHFSRGQHGLLQRCHCFGGAALGSVQRCPFPCRRLGW